MEATAGNPTNEPRENGDSGSENGVTISLTEYLNAAIKAHAGGNLDAAEKAYETILAAVPENPDALHFLGVLRYQQEASDEALRLIQTAINIRPGDAQQHNNLGKVLEGLDRLDDAEEHFHKAVEFDPGYAEAHANLGLVLLRNNSFTEAMDSFEEALKFAPDMPLANKHLGALRLKQSQPGAAEQYLRTYLKQVPDDAQAISNLGYALQKQGQLKEAEQVFLQAVEIAAESPELRHNLRTVLSLEGQGEKARELFRQLLQDKPDMWVVEAGFAYNLAKRGFMEQAKEIFWDILELVPDDAAVCNDIAAILAEFNQIEDAIEIYNRVFEIDPDFAQAHNGLGCVYILNSQDDLAVSSLKRAISIKPDMAESYTSLCRALWNLHGFDEAKIYADTALELAGFMPKNLPDIHVIYRGLCDFEGLDRLGDIKDICDQIGTKGLQTLFLGLLVFADEKEQVHHLRDLVLRWAEGVEDEVAAAVPLPPPSERGKGEKLRIGFLSSDLRTHSVSRFLTPLMGGYDHDRFEFHCYSTIRALDDERQQFFQQHVDHFSFVVGHSNPEIAKLIREDGIDILFDLNGFTRGTRVGVLGYKPAPVQMTWLGYPFTCGIKAIDYAVMDRFMKPADDAAMIEKPLIMPEACISYGREKPEPIAPDLPMDRNGVVTFGTLNNPYKYTPKMISLWAEVMNRVPDSGFLIVRPEAKSQSFRGNVTEAFGHHGIEPERLFFINNRAGDKSHFAFYNDIDISLDTSPLTGGTTTYDAVFMGVPVVTLVGDAFHQRISYSVLMHCGLEELCTFTPQDFVERAVRLAAERDKLLAWRHGLRDVMEASPLCDDERFIFQFQAMLEQVAELHGLRGDNPQG